MGLISTPPMGRPTYTQRYREVGADPAADARSAAWRIVTPGLLPELGIAIVRGRGFGPSDVAGAPRVAIVSESFARRNWPDGSDAIGRALRLGDEEEPWTVIGIVRDLRNPESVDGLESTIYQPLAQAPFSRGTVILRTAPDQSDLIASVQNAIWSVDREIAIGDVSTMDQLLDDYFADQRAMSALAGVFSFLALSITIYSLLALVSHATLRRRREIGIRLALGARSSRIVRASMFQGLRWVALGGVLGVGAAAGLARLIASLLAGIDPLDPVVFTAVPAVVLLLAALASWLPARGVARMDLMATLRAD